MIVGVGIDLCQIERMERAIEKPHFVARVFTAAEAGRIQAASGVRRAEIAAGLFAAKEAVAKALGTGFDGFGTASIEIVPDRSGRPVCHLTGGALDQARAIHADPERVWISITHEGGMAAATAILQGERSTS